MKKTSLVAIVILSTCLLWCLDRAATSTADAAGEGCACQTVTVAGVIGENGFIELVLPVEVVPDSPVPLLAVYEHSSVSMWRPVDFVVDRGRAVIVFGDPGTSISVVALRTR